MTTKQERCPLCGGPTFQGRCDCRLPAQYEELYAYWKCDTCDGRGTDGIARYQGEFQPPECYPCSDCGGNGRVSTKAYTNDQMHAYAEQEKAPLQAELTQLRAENAHHRETAPMIIEENQELQAKIDELMLEFCPERMTPEQTAEWAAHQKAASEHADDLTTQYRLGYLQGIEKGKALGMDEQSDELASLREECAALRKDAERYRWLRHGDNDKKIIGKNANAPGGAWLPRNEKLDAAIDEAMNSGSK